MRKKPKARCRDMPKQSDWLDATGEGCGSHGYEDPARSYTEIASVLASWNTDYHDASCMFLVKMKDGRVFFGKAWSDYTGHG